MSTQGTATLDFGTGDTVASVAVTGQSGISTSNLVEAWILPAATSNNTSDNHIVVGIDVFANTIVNGTGFTITGICRNGMAYGQYNIAWVWA